VRAQTQADLPALLPLGLHEGLPRTRHGVGRRCEQPLQKRASVSSFLEPPQFVGGLGCAGRIGGPGSSLAELRSSQSLQFISW
jgi:hypothetical protein